MVRTSPFHGGNTGSSPVGVSSVGQAVKTSPFHGGNTGSSPVPSIFFIGLSPNGKAQGFDPCMCWFESS